jgi:hypothetical protein
MEGGKTHKANKHHCHWFPQNLCRVVSIPITLLTFEISQTEIFFDNLDEYKSHEKQVLEHTYRLDIGYSIGLFSLHGA